MKTVLLSLLCVASLAVASIMMWQASQDSAGAARIFERQLETDERLRSMEERVADQERSLDQLRHTLLDLRLFSIPEQEAESPSR